MTKAGWRKAFSQGLQPHELSLAVALGAACACFPVLGLATPLCVAAGLGFRLNQAVIQAVNGLTSPLYPAAVFGCIQLGATALHAPIRLSASSAGWLRQLPALEGRALAGWALAAPLAAGLIYGACRAILLWKSTIFRRTAA